MCTGIDWWDISMQKKRNIHQFLLFQSKGANFFYKYNIAGIQRKFFFYSSTQIFFVNFEFFKNVNS